MQRPKEQFGSPRVALTLVICTATLTAVGSRARADDPILYGPNPPAAQYYYPAQEEYYPVQQYYPAQEYYPAAEYHHSGGRVYGAPYPEGERVYGIQHFKPPRKGIYAPPPVYQPRGFYPGPFWPYFGFYGPWGWGWGWGWGGASPYGAYYYSGH